jgi:hypothetical protein
MTHLVEIKRCPADLLFAARKRLRSDGWVTIEARLQSAEAD